MRSVFVRPGLAAAGTVYLAMGIVSARVALHGARLGEQGVPGALRYLLERPRGPLVLGAVVAGLAGIALAEAVAAFQRRRNRLARLGLAVNALGYATLAWAAARWLLRISREGSSEREGIAWLLGQAWGAFAVETAGAIVAGAGLLEIFRGALGRLPFQRSLLPRRLAAALAGIARFGLVARGVVLGAVGWFLVRAAEGLDPGRAQTMGGALSAFSGGAFGPALAGLAALGLAAYGVYLWTLALLKKRV